MWTGTQRQKPAIPFPAVLYEYDSFHRQPASTLASHLPKMVPDTQQICCFLKKRAVTAECTLEVLVAIADIPQTLDILVWPKNTSSEYLNRETGQAIILVVSSVNQTLQLLHSYNQWLHLQWTDKEVSTIITHNFRKTPVQQKLAILLLWPLTTYLIQ